MFVEIAGIRAMSQQRIGCLRKVIAGLSGLLLVGLLIWAGVSLEEASWLSRWDWTEEEQRQIAASAEVGEFEDLDFVVLSDLHLGKWNDELALQLMTASKKIGGCPAGDGTSLTKPRFLLTCGDNIDNYGDAVSQYRRFKKALAALDIPCFYVSGNHEVYGPKDAAQGLRREPFSGGNLYYSFQRGGIHFLVLNHYTDTQGDNPGADLGDEQRRWFRRQILSIGTRAPIILVFHPAPKRFSNLWFMPRWIAMDRKDARFLGRMTQGFNVVASLFGHYHRQFVTTWLDKPAICIGSITHDSATPLVIGHVRQGRLSFLAYDPGDVEGPRDRPPIRLVPPIELIGPEPD